MKKSDKLYNIHKANLILEQKRLDELDLGSYGNAMDKTDSFPYTQKHSERDNPRDLGNKQARVNKMARERFTQEYYKKFPKGTKILTTEGVYAFEFLKFEANHTMYNLAFADNEGHYIYVSYDKAAPNGLYVQHNMEHCEIAPESIPKVQEMLSYNLQAR